MTGFKLRSVLVPALATLTLGIGIGLAGCGDDGHSHDHGDADTAVDCSNEPRADTFVIGLEKQGTNGITVRIEDAVPLPPARNDNTWKFTVLDGTTPLDGATVDVKPFMPDHGHGTTVNEVVTPTGTAGEYEATPINLWMPGYWEVEIDVDTGSKTDSVMFKVCVPG